MTTLLNLPAELRNQIYLNVFTSRDHLTHSIQRPNTAFPTNALSLLLTCRQIHHEAALLAYTTTSFLTTSHRARTLLSNLKSSTLPPSLIHSITSLTFAGNLFPNLKTRLFALFLENITQITSSLPALEEAVVLFECHSPNDTGLRYVLDSQLSIVVAVLREMVPGASFERQGAWASEPAPPSERLPRERGVFLLCWKEGSESKERSLRVEFLGCWPRRGNVKDASEEEVSEALKADLTSGWELKRRERPYLTVGATDPAERMGRHRRSLGSNGSESPGRSVRSEWWGTSSPRSSLGLGSPRSSFGGEWSSPGRRSVGTGSEV